MEKLPHITQEPKNEGDWFEVLANLARYLRSPQGCPWDRKQSAHSFATYLKDEVDEYIEALESEDHAHSEEEFGDCLFVLLASAACAEEEGRLSLAKALERAHTKMVRRHGHVFGEEKAETPEAALDAWEAIKAQERAEKARQQDGKA